MDAGFGQALLHLLELDINDAAARTILEAFAVNLLLISSTSPMASDSSLTAALVTQQLDNLANMAERTASPEFKQGFQAFIRARAKSANSSLTYRDAQGRLVQEWPNTGKVEILAETST